MRSTLWGRNNIYEGRENVVSGKLLPPPHWRYRRPVVLDLLSIRRWVGRRNDSLCLHAGRCTRPDADGVAETKFHLYGKDLSELIVLRRRSLT
jgi:hypothetical protein